MANMIQRSLVLVGTSLTLALSASAALAEEDVFTFTTSPDALSSPVHVEATYDRLLIRIEAYCSQFDLGPETARCMTEVLEVAVVQIDNSSLTALHTQRLEAERTRPVASQQTS